MDSISLKAYAKINIGLDITGRRDDGYHLLRTCMQTIDLYDVVTVSKAAGQTQDIRITASSGAVPADERNIAWQAAALVKEKFCISDKILIDIEKNIPMAAGLAGGSTDGAAVIKAMDELFCPGMDIETMDELAKKLGADVPFCLRKGLWLCEGIGEILTELSPVKDVWAAVIKPDFAVSTAWCYRRFDELKEADHPDMEGVICASKAGDLKAMCEAAQNVLEQVVCPRHPEIEDIKDRLIKSGALGAFMSGSGSAVFGLFDDEEKAKKALSGFGGRPYLQESFLAGLIY